MALPTDRNKKEQFFGSLAKEGHPMAKTNSMNVDSII